MFVLCLLYKDGSMEHKWHEGQKVLEVQKMYQRKRKKSRRGHGSLSLVIVVCCQVEVSAKG
jgi:hypothetical protein